jgi:hypothetical protein
MATSPLLFSKTLDAVQQAGVQPTLTGGVRTPEASRASEQLWQTERVQLLRELSSDDPAASAAIDAWRNLERDTDELSPLVAHERSRMLDKDSWD